MEEDVPLLSSDTQTAEKQFKWFNLPIKIRHNIIEIMDYNTKFLFAICSDVSALDMPKNFIKKVSFNEQASRLNVYSDDDFGFSMHFARVDRICKVSFVSMNTQEYWKMDETGSLSEVILKHFQRMSIKSTNFQRELIGSEMSEDSQIVFSFEKAQHIQKADLLKTKRRQTEQICLFCEKSCLQYEMTTIPDAPEKLARWIEILGPQFARNVEKTSVHYICREHIDEQTSGVNRMPKVLNNVANTVNDENKQEITRKLLRGDSHNRKRSLRLQIKRETEEEVVRKKKQEDDLSQAKRFKKMETNNEGVMLNKIEDDEQKVILEHTIEEDEPVADARSVKCDREIIRELTQSHTRFKAPQEKNYDEKVFEPKEEVLDPEIIAMEEQIARASSKKSVKKFEMFDLPFTIRKKIIGFMDNDTKVSYLLCSEDCAAEMSKNLFKNVEYSNSSLKITIDEKEIPTSQLIFNNKEVLYKGCGFMRTVWNVKERGTPAIVLARYFRRIIHNCIDLEGLVLKGNFPYKYTSIKKLKILENFEIGCDRSDVFECGFMNVEQLYKISKSVKIMNVPLSQFPLEEMSAAIIQIHPIKFSSNFINQYLKAFIDGQINESVQNIKLNMPEGSLLNIDQVIKGLGIIEKRKSHDGTSIALVSKGILRRVGVIRLWNGQEGGFSGICMKFYKKNEFEKDVAEFNKFGAAVQKYLSMQL